MPCSFLSTSWKFDISLQAANQPLPLRPTYSSSWHAFCCSTACTRMSWRSAAQIPLSSDLKYRKHAKSHFAKVFSF